MRRAFSDSLMNSKDKKVFVEYKLSWSSEEKLMSSWDGDWPAFPHAGMLPHETGMRKLDYSVSHTTQTSSHPQPPQWSLQRLPQMLLLASQPLIPSRIPVLPLKLPPQKTFSNLKPLAWSIYQTSANDVRKPLNKRSVRPRPLLMAVMAISQHQAQRRLAPGMFLMGDGQIIRSYCKTEHMKCRG